MSRINAAFCALFFTLCASAQTQLPHLFCIDDHTVCRGKQPRPQDYAELKREGFKTIIDLRGGWIHKPHESREARAAGIEYRSFRLSGIWEPHDQQMATILKVLEDPARVPAFIHCRRGDDRTGMVLACYRIAHDHWKNEDALNEARHNGMSMLEVFMQNYIRHFDPTKAQIPADAPASASR